MRRDPNLQDLSRDHHHALVLARRAVRAATDGSDAEVALMWGSIAAAFSAELEPHFEIEERLLLPPLEAAGADEVARRTRADHQQLRALLMVGDDARGQLRRFGELLRDHVRFEEAELFPAAEQLLGPAELAAVALASAATGASLRRASERADRLEGSDP